MLADWGTAIRMPSIAVQTPVAQVSHGTHFTPQPPQLRRSLGRAAQDGTVVVPHWVKPALHRQLPSEQKALLPQETPQLPQLLSSVSRSAHPAVAPGGEQKVVPAPQSGTQQLGPPEGSVQGV